MSTSLPETVTTVAVVKLDFLDMVVANVFGANFMSLFLVFIAVTIYCKGPLLYDVSGIHMLSSAGLIIMSAVFILGIIYRSEKQLCRIGLDSLVILVGYMVILYLIFKFDGN